MNALKKLIASLLFALLSTSAFAVTDAQVFAYAETNFPSLFTVPATAGQYLQYNFRYYPASGNYLAVDTSGIISILGPYTGGVVTPVGLVTDFAPIITAWEATQGGTAPVAAAGTQMGGAIQGAPLGQTTNVTTFAGSGMGGSVVVNAVGKAASFSGPSAITTDGVNLYVVDNISPRIRKIEIATGAVTTLAGSGTAGAADGTGTAASFQYPSGITTDGANLYVTDSGNNKIRKIVIATGVVTTFAGSGATGAADATGTAASFSNLSGITTDGANLYVGDASNFKIRKIVIATGAVTTLAGSGAMGAVDAVGTAASFFSPSGMTTDGTNLYVADTSNNKIRKIVIATGAVTTFAGTGVFGSADGTGTAASFSYPAGITSDGTNLYVVDIATNPRVRKIEIATGVVTTLAGSSVTNSIDGVGASAAFNVPSGITTDGTDLYVAETGSNKIRKLQAGGATGGTGGTGGGGTGATPPCLLTGSATSNTGALSYKYCYANLTAPFTCDAAGMGNSAATLDATIRSGITSASAATWTYQSISSCSAAPAGTQAGNILTSPAYVGTGVVTTLAGTGNTEIYWTGNTRTDGAANVATFDFTDPWNHGLNKSNMVSDGASLFVVDQGHSAIRKVDIATGAVSTLAGGRSGSGDGTGTAAFFLKPIGITIDETKANLYVADYQFIRKIEIATGIVTTIAGMGGSYYNFANATTSVAKDMLWHPQGITTVGTAMYLTDSVSSAAGAGSGRVLKVDLTNGAISTFTSLSGYQDSGGNWSHAITTDGASLYIAGDGIVRKIDLATKAEIVVAGSTSAAGMGVGVDGIGTAATFNSKNHGIAIDGSTLYVSDLSAVRKIDMTTGLVTTIAGSGAAGYADGTGGAAQFKLLGGMTTVGSTLYVTDYSTIRKVQ